MHLTGSTSADCSPQAWQEYEGHKLKCLGFTSPYREVAATREEQGCSVTSLLRSRLAHCCASQMQRRGEKTRSNGKLRLKPFPSPSSLPFLIVLLQQQTGFRVDSKLLRLHLLLKLSCRGEKLTGQMEGSLRLEIIWEAVCLTDRPDLQAKTYSTAPILTRELPNGINIVSKYNLVLI